MLKFGLSVLALYNKLKYGEYPLAVLYFHRVLEQANPFCPDDLTMLQFELLVTRLNQYFTLLPLTQALELQKQKALHKNALVLTFDDGYVDNYDNALDVLERLGVKASFFVATQGTEQGYLWSDKLAFSLEKTSATELSAFGQCFILNTQQDRANAYLFLVNQIKFMSNDERDNTLQVIYQNIGELEPPRCMMTAEQLKDLHNLGHDVGAHTHSHSILAFQSDQVAEQEIAQSIDELTTILGQKSGLFAYPNGWFGRDFDQRHQTILKNLGVTIGVATNDGGIVSTTDRTALPRFMPHRKEFNQFCLSILKIAGE